MDTQQISWQETDTAVYQQLAAIAVPERARQMATVLTLLPFQPDEPFRVVEVGCGEGRLAAALLTCFPAAEVIALDGSAGMREVAAARLAPFGGRARVAPFDLFGSEWLAHVDGAGAVVSSLCVHHLDEGQKQALFGQVFERLAGRGALIIADIVAPQRGEARTLFAAQWDRSAAAQAQAVDEAGRVFDLFEAERWNIFTHPDPAVDKPSPLFAQLRWLAAAGFGGVDCFWMQAGHAVYGGYKGAAVAGTLGFAEALAAVGN